MVSGLRWTRRFSISLTTWSASTPLTPSKDSFPGDHGMMLLIFASFMWRYFGRRAFAIALVIFVVFAFPRVMIGAHWFTDIAVGSLTAVLIGAPWVLMTPLSDKVITLFERYLPGGRTKI